MPSTTQFSPNRRVLCFLVESTASRKMPPKATLAPRLWQRVSSTTIPDDPAGDQVGQEQGGQDDAEVIPLPGRRVEDGVGGVVVPLGRPAGGEPDLADGPWPLT